jgi:Cu+-exporting ATPase
MNDLPPQNHDAHAYHHEHGPVDKTNGHGDGPDDKRFTDPVCGMKVATNPANEIAYEGATYHFCSTKCMDKFRATPLQYVGAAKPEAMQAVAEGTIYTCPMHPQIREPQPGNCPICGMALEPMLPSLDDEENPELVDFKRRFWWTLPLTVCVTLLAMAGHRIFLRGSSGTKLD